MYEIDFTTLRLLKEHLEMPINVSSEDNLLRSLIAEVSEAIGVYLDRHVLLKERTEYLDVMDGQAHIYLRGWPISVNGSGVPLVQMWNDYNLPPTWAATTELTNGEDFIAYPEASKFGLVRFAYGLVGGPRALKVTYTAGMATVTAVEGENGQVTAANTFTAAWATFQTDGVVAGDKLLLIGGSNEGLYTVAAVPSETTLTTTEAFGNIGTANEVYSVATAGLVGRYPSLGLAANLQAAYLYKIKDSPEVLATSVSGTNVQMAQTKHQDVYEYGAMGLRPDVKALLQRFKWPEWVIQDG